jgi:hypothetical protein
MIDESNLWEFGSLRSDLKIETVNVTAPPILHLVTLRFDCSSIPPQSSAYLGLFQ